MQKKKKSKERKTSLHKYVAAIQFAYLFIKMHMIWGCDHGIVQILCFKNNVFDLEIKELTAKQVLVCLFGGSWRFLKIHTQLFYTYLSHYTAILEIVNFRRVFTRLNLFF